MVKLIDVLKAHKEENTKEKGCSVAQWLGTLTKEEADEFIACLQAPNTTALGLYNTLVSSGIPLPFKQTLFRAHVKGYCTCQQ